MTRAARRKRASLALRFPPSDPCSCETCRSYCERPGWWTVEEAARALEAGLGPRMTLEWYPGHGVGVLAPAVSGLEGWIAVAVPAGRSCTFLADGLCALHGTGLVPLECRFCHHDRPGRGRECHAALAEDWRTPAGRRLTELWSLRHARRSGGLTPLEPG